MSNLRRRHVDGLLGSSSGASSDIDGHDAEAYTGESDHKASLNSLRASAAHTSEDLMPSRLRNFMAMAEGNIAGRIYCELVIRYPASPCSRTHIEAVCDSFGPFEYQNEGPKGTYTHVVRFFNFEDAVKCYLQLNGAFIDPQSREDAITEWRQMVEEELQSAHSKAWCDENPEAAEQLRQELTAGSILGAGTNNTLQIKPQDENERFVFITCDFFRSAFAPADVPKSAVIRGNFRSRPKDPVNDLIHRLASGARAFSGIYGLVKSHEMDWDAYIFCVNYLSFFEGPPPPSSKDDTPTTALKGLMKCKFNVSNYLAFVDTNLTSATSRYEKSRNRTIVDDFLNALVDNRLVIAFGFAAIFFVSTVVLMALL